MRRDTSLPVHRLRDYDISIDLAALHRRQGFDMTFQDTAPTAAISFLESTDFEDANRSIAKQRDADTNACIVGALAEVHYGGGPREIQSEIFTHLDTHLRDAIVASAKTFNIPLAKDST